jgi:hypothetical protein
LNGALYQQDKFEEIEHLWKTIRKKDIWSGPVLWNLLMRGGAYSTRKLLTLVRKHVDIQEFVRDFECSYVELESGTLESAYIWHRAWNHNALGELVPEKNGFPLFSDKFHKGVVASTVIPAGCVPMEMGDILGSRTCVDGGVRDATPLGAELLKSRADGVQIDHIYVVLCFPEESKRWRRRKVAKWGPKRLYNILKESISTMNDEVVMNDLTTFRTVNRILEKVGDSVGQFRHIPVTVIAPPMHPGSGTDFSRARLDRLYRQGYEIANIKLTEGEIE